MAIRTYIPGLLAAFNYLKKFIAAHAEVLKPRMGNGLYALVVLAVDLAIIASTIITAGEPAPDEPWADFTAVNTLSSAQINEVEGAISKFYNSIGVTP